MSQDPQHDRRPPRALGNYSLTRTSVACAAARYTSVAFDSWKQMVLRTKELMQRTFQHMMNRSLSLVWRRWVDLVHEQKQQRAAANRAVGRWRLRFVAQTFEVRSPPPWLH